MGFKTKYTEGWGRGKVEGSEELVVYSFAVKLDILMTRSQVLE